MAYNIYFGGAPKSYTNSVRVGNVTNATVSGFAANATYYLAATAVDSNGRESEFSGETSFQSSPKTNLVVSAASLTRGYGSNNPVFSGTVTGLRQGDNITAHYSSCAGVASPVGAYPIAVTLQDPGGKLTNYNVVMNNGTLTVTQTLLTVTANNQIRACGITNSALTGTMTGARTLDGLTASFTTAATISSPVGAYSILPSISDPNHRLANYFVSMKDGTLTIEPAGSTNSSQMKLRINRRPADPRALLSAQTLALARPVETQNSAATAEITTTVATPISLSTGVPMFCDVPQVQPDGGVLITGSTEPGRIWTIEVSSELGQWSPLGSVTGDTAGRWRFVDADAVRPVRFYRARLAP